MPRVRRGLVDGFVYHVINRGNGKSDVFLKQMDFEAFIEIIAEAKTQYDVKLFSYCLMPNHFHFLVAPRKADDLSRWMQWLMTSHVRRYHKHYGTSGHVWQGRFKSFIVQKDHHLITVARYIEANPVRAGLVRKAHQWIWSSHMETSGEKPRSMADEVPVKLPENWREYVDTPFSGIELERVRKSVNRQAPFGSLTWRDTMCRELGLESTLRPRGRPMKDNNGGKK